MSQRLQLTLAFDLMADSLGKLLRLSSPSVKWDSTMKKYHTQQSFSLCSWDWPRTHYITQLASNSRTSCLSLPSTGITSICDNTWLYIMEWIKRTVFDALPAPKVPGFLCAVLSWYVPYYWSILHDTPWHDGSGYWVSGQLNKIKTSWELKEVNYLPTGRFRRAWVMNICPEEESNECSNYGSK
jgi:hypothetical protein